MTIDRQQSGSVGPEPLERRLLRLYKKLKDYELMEMGNEPDSRPAGNRSHRLQIRRVPARARTKAWRIASEEASAYRRPALFAEPTESRKLRADELFETLSAAVQRLL